MADGGDGYEILSKYEVAQEALFSESDILGIYIRDDLKGVIPDKYGATEGRINVYSKTINTDENSEENKNSNNDSDSSNSQNSNIVRVSISLLVLIIYFIN